MSEARLNSCAIVFVTEHIEKTAAYYREVLGFRVVEHYEHVEKFAALYRDAVEIILVQAKYGQVRSNRANFGAGFDAYLVPENAEEAVCAIYAEVQGRGANIVQPLGLTPYGNYEFALEDIDGRVIGIGHIQKPQTFFRDQSAK